MTRKPVGLTAPYRADDDDDIQDYKKPWVGLTDAELAEFSEAKLGSYDLCLEVEARLKEKNT